MEWFSELKLKRQVNDHVRQIFKMQIKKQERVGICKTILIGKKDLLKKLVQFLNAGIPRRLGRFCQVNWLNIKEGSNNFTWRVDKMYNGWAPCGLPCG